MSEDYGLPVPPEHQHTPHRPAARYLVLIAAADAAVARLFLAQREPAGEIDAASEEVAQMTQGLVPVRSALDPEWDHALAGHSAAERGTAEVYTLDV